MAQYSSTDNTATGASVSAVLAPETGTITYTVTTPSGLSTSVTAPASQNPQQSVATLNAIRQQLAAQNGGSQLGLGITGFGDRLNATYVDVTRQAETAQAAAAATNTPVPQSPSPPAPTNNAADPAVPPAAPQASSTTPSVTAPAPVGDEALQATEDAQAAALAAQESRAFAPLPVSGDEAIDAANEAELAQLREAEGAAIFAPSPVSASGDEALDAANEAELAQLREAEGRAIFGPAPVATTGDEALAATEAAQAANLDPNDFAAAAGAAAQSQLRDQFTLQQRFNTSSQGDWRVRLRLAPGAKYLYRAQDPGILQPLVPTDGIIFPYTPTISTQYSAKYDSYNLTHSNYRGYFYQSSQVGDITVTGTFTAQDTAEAEYLLAVIHFFRSVTKMFYGKDPQRGSPPPLVELSGFGEYQFNNHPCLVASFNYTLPNNVDYIQVKPNNQGLNMSSRTNKVSSSPASTIESVLRRLTTSQLPKGAQGTPADLGVVRNTVNGLGQTTYVPTKIEISVVLHPLQTRQQVSQGFSLENFAKGNLLKGGFW
jgi:hypothetical protein